MRRSLSNITASIAVGLAFISVALLPQSGVSGSHGVVAPDKVMFNEDELEVAKSLTGKPGDATKGADVFSNRKLGNCLACHANMAMNNQLFHGDVGPELDGVGDRYSEGQLRAIVIDSKMVFGEETVMPGFYSLKVGVNVREQSVGKTILSAEQVEDLVAYLVTLKE